MLVIKSTATRRKSQIRINFCAVLFAHSAKAFSHRVLMPTQTVTYRFIDPKEPVTETQFDEDGNPLLFVHISSGSEAYKTGLRYSRHPAAHWINEWSWTTSSSSSTPKDEEKCTLNRNCSFQTLRDLCKCAFFLILLELLGKLFRGD